MTIRTLASIPCICLAPLLTMHQLDAGQFRVVATTDVPVPGAAAPFDGFGGVSLNNQGQVAFGARRRVSPEWMSSAGIWSEGNGNGLTMVDSPGYGHWNLVLNDLGVVTFTNGSLMQGSTLGDSRIVAEYGQVAPGLTPAGSTFSDIFNYTNLAFNDQNQVAFVKQAGGYARLYAGTSRDSLRLIASAGQQIIDEKEAPYVHSLSVQSLNDVGDLLFYARMFDDPAFTGQPLFASYLWTRNQELKRIAGAGDSIETDRGTIEVSSVNSQLNNSGQIGLLINESVLAVSSPSGYKVVATENDSIGDERIFYFTNQWAMAGSGDIVYEAAMMGGDADPYQARMLLKNAPGEIPKVIAKGMTQAPGAPAGHVFSPYFGNFAVNGHGQVAFTSDLWDATTRTSIGHGIWVENKHGILETIARTGDFVDVDNGPGIDLRQIIGIAGPGTGGNQDGMGSLFNDREQVAFIATFADYTQAILVSAATIPEPTGAVLALFCLVGVGSLRGRRLQLN